MSRLDIRGARDVPLYADYNVLEILEKDGGAQIVSDALFEHDCRVRGQLGVCGKRIGESESIILPCRMRDDVGCPSQSKGCGG